MRYRESDIQHETKTHWVLHDRKAKCYTVYKIGLTHSTPDSSYKALDLAVCRCDYLTKRANKVN